MKAPILPIVVAALVAATTACKSPKPVTSTTGSPADQSTLTASATVQKPVRLIYHPSETRINDLIHTKLEVAFNWELSQLNGKATLDLRPYYYPTDSLTLDAKGFELKSVMLDNGALTDLQYTYDGENIFIELDRTYKRDEQYRVVIEYTAKPEEIDFGGSAAISADKGLYFIDPRDEDPHKRTQIWTQGETEANSCWFPTIDSPNEKMTQEVVITVRKDFKTLSNGILVFSTDNGDGTRTDFWKQSLPHTPYLVMMAVGEFVEVKEMWRDSIEVSYFVEPEWEQYAKDIFGETPEMMTFFSDLLEVDYPWEKYHQVVVRDYVSGAMENTTATIHGDFLYRNRRELLDEHNEAIIAHELFHHWFGDLVTCESWANLPLNESFATYSEYLWFEHKHGRDEADLHLKAELDSYLREAKDKQEDMIRYDYSNREDMFDSHSYAKGGRILHMLRKYLGDEAFFDGLGLYLTQNAYKPAEIHHLRLAMEEVCGEDLNWFFDQWFLSSGHPELEIKHGGYDAGKGVQRITILQQQDLAKTPLYRIPLEVDVYVGGKATRHRIWLDQIEQDFEIPCSAAPDLVNVDAEKVLLGKKREKKSIETWAYQFNNAPLFLDRLEALKKCSKSSQSGAVQVIMDAMNDPFWNIRQEAVYHLKYARKAKPEAVKRKLLELAAKDPDARVREAAIGTLYKYYKNASDVSYMYEEAMKDSSYAVNAAGLTALYKANSKRGLEVAAQHEDAKGTALLVAIAGIYASEGNAKKHDWYIQKINETADNVDSDLIYYYTQFLKTQEEDVVKGGIAWLEGRATTTIPYWMKLDGYYNLLDLQYFYKDQTAQLQVRIESLKREGKDMEAMEASQAQNRASNMIDYIYDRLMKLLDNEKDPNILQRFE